MAQNTKAPPPQPLGTMDTEPAETPRLKFDGDLGEDALEKLREYQVVTIPPEARERFLLAQLPLAPPELFEPPKAQLLNSDEAGHVSSAPSRSATAGRWRAEPRIIAALVSLIALAGLLLFLWPSSERPQLAAPVPSGAGTTRAALVEPSASGAQPAPRESSASARGATAAATAAAVPPSVEPSVRPPAARGPAAPPRRVQPSQREAPSPRVAPRPSAAPRDPRFNGQRPWDEE